MATSYREVLYARLAQNSAVRGYQKRLAEAAGCRPSYLSQVLNGHVQLTPDQAAGLAEFWRLSDDETEYFLGLVGRERSSSPALKRHLERRAAALAQRHMRVSQRISGGSVASVEDQSTYFGTWYLPALHALLGIQRLRSPAALAAHLRLPQEVVQAGLEQLVALRLIEPHEGAYRPTERSLHLRDDSPILSAYHSNWRQQAVLRTQERRSDELHFTGLYAIGESEATAIRALLVEAVARSRELAVAAPVETRGLCVLCDVFAF